MKTREEIQAGVAVMGEEPHEVEATEKNKLKVYPPSVGLMMALRAIGNTMAASLEEPELTRYVTQEDTLVFYWAVTTEPSLARAMLSEARRSGDQAAIHAAADELAWLLTPYAIARLNEAVAQTREQVQAVTVAIIPDGKAGNDSKN